MAACWSSLLGGGEPEGDAEKAGIASVLVGEATSEFSEVSSSELSALENNSL